MARATVAPRISVGSFSQHCRYVVGVGVLLGVAVLYCDDVVRRSVNFEFWEKQDTGEDGLPDLSP